jgi:uracil-DNA glycosylase
MTLDAIAAEARACTLCAGQLPLGPRPVLRVSASARLLIIGQAPGTKVHASGIPWDDASGLRLRAWLGMTPEEFYDESRVAIVPMGLCYPGVLPRGGDRPPMPICAPTWHPRLLPLMPEIRLTLLVGSYAIARTLGPGPMAARVAAFAAAPEDVMALPHPSWRTIGWERRNPWFAADVLPLLRQRIAYCLATVQP